MKKPELTDKEKELYDKIVSNGTMGDMFIFGYAVGRARLAKEELDMLNKTVEV